jgi:hypothetical protein
MKKVIETKLDSALTICLVTDIWTNKVYADFLAVAVIMVNEHYEQEFFVIGMKSMQGKHTAENIKPMIESIVNSYSFDKAKCHGKILLISQNDLSNYLNSCNLLFF